MALSLITSDGIIVWEKHYGNTNSDYGGAFQLLKDKTILMDRSVNDGNNGPTHAYLEKIDMNGNVIWSKQFSDNNFLATGFVRPIENLDGTILFSCGVKNAQGTVMARVYLLDPFGNTLWFKDYFTRTDIAQYIYDIKPTDDGGYIMGGSAFAVGGTQQSAWLIRTNCNGEEGVQFPITPAACTQYDCTQFPIHANFTANMYVVDLATTNGEVEFTNSSNNTTNRVWNFGDGVIDYTDEIITHAYQTVGAYQIQLITYHGPCSDTTIQTVEVINSLGLEPSFIPKLNVYPNPTKNKVFIAYNFPPSESLVLNLLSFDGKLVYSNKISTTSTVLEINTSNLETGIYFVNLKSENSTKTVKLSIVK